MSTSSRMALNRELFTKLPSGQIDEYVLERRVVRREAGELSAYFIDVCEQGGERLVKLPNGERNPPRVPSRRVHARECTERIEVDVRSVFQCELDDLLPAERLDELFRR